MQKKETKRILILNDGSAYENWGIKACIDGIFALFQHMQLDIEYDGIPHKFMHKKYAFNPKLFGRPVFLDNNRLAQKLIPEFQTLPRVADEYDYVADQWVAGHGGPGAHEFIERAKKADVIVFNAEGSTYRDNIGAIRGLFMLWFAKTRLNKTCLFMNGSVTLTPVDAILPAMIRKVFEAIDGVMVRESCSFESVAEYYPFLEQKIRVFPDSVFALPNEEENQEQMRPFLGKDFFAFSLSMLPMDHKRTGDKSAVIDLILQLKKITPNVVFLAKDIEDQVLRDLIRETDALFVGPHFTYAQVENVLAHAKFLVSGRYHHCIFATKVGCPVIPLHTSSHKIQGLQRFFQDCMPKPVDPTDMWYVNQTIVESAREILKQGEGLRMIYKNRAEDLRKKTLVQAEILNEILTRA